MGRDSSVDLIGLSENSVFVVSPEKLSSSCGSKSNIAVFLPFGLFVWFCYSWENHLFL